MTASSWAQDPLLSTRKGILGIESSCDETAAAVVTNTLDVLSSVVSSQVDLHATYGGVVPEIASRAHLELLVPVVSQALQTSGVDPRDLAAVAVTAGPGLAGALLVGLASAKALALSWGIPFVTVNHLEAHLYAAGLEKGKLDFPVVTLLVSGGHTMLVWIERPGRYRVLGETLDDAAGEAFDKVARYLGLGYPGGPAVDRVAKLGDREAVDFPRPLAGQGLSFSFSGLKTAVIRWADSHPEAAVADIAASFQEAAVDVLVRKTRLAARELGARGVCLAGGVAANSRLRERTVEFCEQDGLSALLPSGAMCTDNAAMVAAAGWARLMSDGPSPWDAAAQPQISLIGGKIA